MPKYSQRQFTIQQIDKILQHIIIQNSFEESQETEYEINELLEIKAQILSFRWKKNMKKY